MPNAQGGKRLSFFVRDAKSPSVSSEEDAEEQIECNKVVYAIHKQLVTQFHPAVKEVAEAGVNLLRAFHAIHKASEAYTNTLLALANTGSKAHPETVEVAGNLHQVALQMRSINDSHRKCIGKFSSIVTKTNEYSVQEKELLKHLLTSFTKKEKGIKKFVEKGLRDPRDLQEFYKAEMKDNVLQQKFRYKFFVDKHSEWLLSYNDMFKTMADILGASDSETESSEEESSDEDEPPRRPVGRSASAASSHKSHDSQPTRPPSSIMREPAAQHKAQTQEWSRRGSVGNSSISVSEQNVAVVVTEATINPNNSENISKDQPLQLRKNNSSFLLPQVREETKSRTSSILKVRVHPQLARNSESSITDTVMNHKGFHLGEDETEVAGILLDLENATASHSVLEENNKQPVVLQENEVVVDTEIPIAEERKVESDEKELLEDVTVVPAPVVVPRKMEITSTAVPVPAARHSSTKTTAKPVEYNPITANPRSAGVADNTIDSNGITASSTKSISPLSPTALHYVKPTLEEKSHTTITPIQIFAPKRPTELVKSAPSSKDALVKKTSSDSRTADWERGDVLICTANYATSGSERCLPASSGQKMELIKVGSKGWIFVRNVDTLATGWFPSIYVERDD